MGRRRAYAFVDPLAVVPTPIMDWLYPLSGFVVGALAHKPWGEATGERRAGNPHAAFDVAGIGNVACRDAVTLADERARQQGTRTST